MIHKISFRNFYSFLEETEVNMTANKRVPETDAYVTTASGARITKLMALIGPNASGKTNLLKCVAFINWFVVLSFKDTGPNEQIAFKPFLFSSKINRSSDFLIEFENDKRVYRYEVSMIPERVLSEKLSSKVKGKKFKKLFSRNWEQKRETYRLDLENFKLPSGFSKLIRQNASIISTAAQVKHLESQEICLYFFKISSNIVESGKVSAEHQRDTIEFYSKNPKIKQKAEEILGKFDLGLSNIKIEKYEGQEKKPIYRLFGGHKNIDTDEEMLLPFDYESSGTKNLLNLLRLILDVLSTGGVAIIDEMEHDLHPLMVSEIVNLFTSPNYNPRNAQLLFSTHTAQVLNKLDKQQIILVEKNKGVSEAWSLTDIKGVRADDNFYAKYMGGAYGGLPKL